MQAAKETLRMQIRHQLSVMTPEDRAEKSRRIAAKLFQLPIVGRAQRIAFFASMPNEVNTRPMIDRALFEGKHVALPRVAKDSKDLGFFEITDLLRETAPGVMGILEPKADCPKVDISSLECVIVPGLAFDADGGRLGRGAGYYDRFLARLSPATAKIGIGFSLQKVKAVPMESHDQKLDWVLTD